MSDRTCVIDGCDRPFLARGWCKKHYRAWQAHGDPLGSHFGSNEERFMQRVEKRSNGCWLWLGPLTPNGYGRFWMNGKRWWVHRASYELFVGPIPDGLQIDHLCHTYDENCPAGACDHRRCVNPEHLEPVTIRENSIRGRGFCGQQARQTHCKRGHEFTDNNTHITARGERVCRECMRMHNLKNYDKRAARLGVKPRSDRRPRPWAESA